MKYTLEVGELIEHLNDVIHQGKKMKYLDKVVKYDFDLNMGGLKLDSWRGIYSELTLNYNLNGKDITLSELFKDLETSIKRKVFRGYKGGKYRMNIDTPVWVDPSEIYIKRMIIGVEDTKDYIILKTLIRKED